MGFLLFWFGLAFFAWFVLVLCLFLMAPIKLYVERVRCLFHVICEVSDACMSTDWLNGFCAITG